MASEIDERKFVPGISFKAEEIIFDVITLDRLRQSSVIYNARADVAYEKLRAFIGSLERAATECDRLKAKVDIYESLSGQELADKMSGFFD